MPSATFGSATTDILRSLSYPLIGILPTGQLMVSFLDRAFEDPAVHMTPVSVQLESSDAFTPGLDGCIVDVAPIGDGTPWGAFALTGLPVRLSYPRALEA